VSVEEFFAEAGPTILAAIVAGETPARLTLTSELYRHLNIEAEGWSRHAERASFGYEPPVPLYGVDVELELGAHHSWQLRTEAGTIWTRGGPLTYSVATPARRR
jgi:hypothetical protein